eukprot:5017379-Amphidinium_carterae.2
MQTGNSGAAIIAHGSVDMEVTKRRQRPCEEAEHQHELLERQVHWHGGANVSTSSGELCEGECQPRRELKHSMYVVTRGNRNCSQVHSEQANCVSGAMVPWSVVQQARWIESPATCDFCHDDVGGHNSAGPTLEKPGHLMIHREDRVLVVVENAITPTDEKGLQ